MHQLAEAQQTYLTRSSVNSITTPKIDSYAEAFLQVAPHISRQQALKIHFTNCRFNSISTPVLIAELHILAGSTAH